MFSVLSISDSDKHFTSAIAEYQKRLWKQIKIEDLKPVKDDNHQFVIQKETKNLIEMLWKKYANWQKILLIKEGKSFSTLEISEVLNAKDTVFVIWGPYGVDDNLRKIVDYRLCFSKMTFPHQLMRLILSEQIYRWISINNNIKYHK